MLAAQLMRAVPQFPRVPACVGLLHVAGYKLDAAAACL